MALSQHFKRSNLAQKKFNFHAWVKKCHFGNFSERGGMAVPCQCSPQESLTGVEKFFLLWRRMNSYKQWKAKLERAHFLNFQSGKITVCLLCNDLKLQEWAIKNSKGRKVCLVNYYPIRFKKWAIKSHSSSILCTVRPNAINVILKVVKYKVHFVIVNIYFSPKKLAGSLKARLLLVNLFQKYLFLH